MKKPKDPELLAIWTIIRALKPIDHAGRERIMAWAWQRFITDAKSARTRPTGARG